MQNAAARLLNSASKYSRITPVPKELHWLPVRFRIHFKILLLTFKARNDIAPDYVKELINVKKHVRYSLRSNSGITISHPAGKMLKSFGDRSFSVAAPTLWNVLPANLRNIISLLTFKSSPKKYLFNLAFNA